jgi:sec-independent protein translocase protein TatA
VEAAGATATEDATASATNRLTDLDRFAFMLLLAASYRTSRAIVSDRWTYAKFRERCAGRGAIDGPAFKEQTMPFGMGFGELVLILVIVVVVFGATKLPQLGDGLGKAIKNFKRAVTSQDEIDVSPGDQPKDKKGELGDDVESPKSSK